MIPRSAFSYCFGDVIVALAQTFISADFGILAFTLLHEGLELGIVGFCNSLGLHLHHQMSAGILNACPYVNNGLFKTRNACILV